MDTRTRVIGALQPHRQPLSRPQGEYLVFHCLVVTADESRRQFFDQSASEQGWEVVLCHDADSAIDYLRRRFAQLAIVDLTSDESGRLSELLSRLSAFGSLLVIVCGHENDIEEEIWARQVGAWLYLPGVDSATGMGLLCGEAKRIVERKWETQHDLAATARALPRAK